MREESYTVVEHGGEELILLPQRAIWWPGERALVLADVHFGKSAAFRDAGVPVPEGESREDLRRIGALVDHWRAKSVVVVGDFFHTTGGPGRALSEMLSGWLEQLACRFLLVRGNHDPRSPDMPGLELSDTLRLGGLTLVHDPEDASTGTNIIAGHLHPLTRVPGAGGGSRVPCFFRTGRMLVLPSFGTFTSGSVVKAGSGDVVYPVAGGKVFCLPAGRRLGKGSR